MDFHGKNVIIFSICCDKNGIVLMGSLFDSLEYFVKIYESNPEILLLLNPIYIQSQSTEQSILQQLTELINARYCFSDKSFLNNIHFIDIKRLFFDYVFNKILVMDLATPERFIKYYIRAKEIIILPEWTDKKHLYQSVHNKVTYYTEMPFCYCNVPYKMKFLFEQYKQFDEFDDALYINYPKLNYKDDREKLQIINKYKKPVMVKDEKVHYDLHKRFNEYVYFQSPLWFDPHPKLFHENKFYKKPYKYYNNNVKDGSYYRYHDSINEKLSDRELSKDDIIVKEMCH